MDFPSLILPNILTVESVTNESVPVEPLLVPVESPTNESVIISHVDTNTNESDTSYTLYNSPRLQNETFTVFYEPIVITEQPTNITITFKQVYTSNVINIDILNNILLPNLKETIHEQILRNYNLRPRQYDIIECYNREDGPSVDLSHNIKFSDRFTNNNGYSFYIRPNLF